MPNEAEILKALSRVNDPELHRDIVSLGMVRDLKVDGSRVSLTVVLTTPACPLKAEIEEDVRRAVKTVPGVGDIEVTFGANVAASRAGLGQVGLPGVKHAVAIASGKGGVGKSTVSVNVAVALAETGAKVGLLDADIYGPSMPLMLGVRGHPDVRNNRLLPHEAYGVKVMSAGFLIQEQAAPIVWRGPMVSQAIRQLLTDVEWGDLDYLLIDLPPGTGDAQLTLCQSVPLTGGVIVMTPQDVATKVAGKALVMLRHLKVPILGIIENMSFIVCPHCLKQSEVFGHGGGRAAAQKLEVPFLGEIPLDIEVCQGSDHGRPILVHNPRSATAEIFRRVAANMAGRISVEILGSPAEAAPAGPRIFLGKMQAGPGAPPTGH